MTGVYYNELDRFPAEWVQRLADAGHLPAGFVDCRDIRDVSPDDVRGYGQAHFFAGIGGWPLALRLAGWPDNVPVWTGSCPCQPFSSAGRGRGTDDPRHLWPEWFRLIRECGPSIVFGEQVASPLGRAWLDSVSADLEGIGYAVGVADLPACGVGAPHIRSRLFFVAYSVRSGRAEGGSGAGERPAPGCGVSGGVADAEGSGRRAFSGTVRSGPLAWLRESQGQDDRGAGEQAGRASDSRSTGVLASPDDAIPGERTSRAGGMVGGFWGDAEWIECRDGKYRPAQPGSFPLAHGIPGRVGRLRGYGNAIVPQVAAEFICAAVEAVRDTHIIGQHQET